MKLSSIWTNGLWKQRSGRLWGAIAGVALTTALLASLGAFIISGETQMTNRAIKDVAVDWQVLLSSPEKSDSVKHEAGLATPLTAMMQVSYADTAGFISNAGGTTQSTGPGKVVGIDPDYVVKFPSQLRLLQGTLNGVIVTQQTASNLHTALGDEIEIQRLGLPSVKVKVDGIAELSNPDSMFQAIGVPVGTAPQAPPDNVILLQSSKWHEQFDPQFAVRPDSVKTQLHISISHQLPQDPVAATQQVKGLAKNVEVRSAGSAIIGNNLATRLGAVRSDALYARVLFLFLGLPGVILAIWLTLSVAASGAQLRRQQQALLRTRGASVKQIVQLAAAEATTVGLGGVLSGLLLAYLATQWISYVPILIQASTIFFVVISAVTGFMLAFCAIVYPVWRDSKQSTVFSAKAVVGRGHKPLWQRLYIDLVLLVIAAISFWRLSGSAYQLVLAPEGVAKTSVNYEAFIAPFFLWVGGVLLLMRFWSLLLLNGIKALSWVLQPIAKDLSHVVSASLGRQQKVITRGVILVVLAISFAVSTSVFNTTYNAQAVVDAQLTNGADVVVSGSSNANAGAKLNGFSHIPGVKAVQTIQHRFAYVGNDLQDIYGIDPLHLGEATTLSDAFFADNNAQANLSKLASTPDGVLVSLETAKDYQLQLGDEIKLRLQQAGDHQYHAVSFHYIGIIKKFPSAPKDSFLVTNASYIAAQTSSKTSEVVLMKVDSNPKQVALSARKLVSDLAGVKVTDVSSVQDRISSSLTSVNLQGLTRLELAFALLFAIGTTGLIVSLGMTERRRTYAILKALGAKQNQLGAFLWSEGILVFGSGVVLGLILGFGVAEMLVKVLTGVFDPPPMHLFIPWTYVTVLLVVGFGSMIAAVYGAILNSRKQVVQTLRGL